MRSAAERGPVVVRPFGGIAILVHKEFSRICRVLLNSERCIIVGFSGFILVNVYLPCAGTIDRSSLCNEILSDIEFCLSSNDSSVVAVAGDFNIDLRAHPCGGYADILYSFLHKFGFVSAYDKFPGRNYVTYCNNSLGQSSLIDYFFVNRFDVVMDVCVFEPSISFSDHLPVICGLNLQFLNQPTPHVAACSCGRSFTTACIALGYG